MRRKYLDQLAAEGKYFTSRDAQKLWGTGPGITNGLLYRFERKGWIERIEKGRYIIIPLGSQKGEYTLNEFVIASALVDDHCIGYWSALHHHGMTEQIPGTVFVQTTTRKKRREILVFGVTYRIVRMDPRRIFGIQKVWLDETSINITDPEKTIVDCLDHPQLCGGVVEVAKGLRSDRLNMELMAGYAQRIGNSGVARRLGYLMELLGLPSPVPRPRVSNYLYLDPTMPKRGERIGRWRLIDNLGPAVLGELE